MDFIQARKIYTYDRLNRLSMVKYGDGRELLYRYDDAGNLVSISENAATSGPASKTGADADHPAAPILEKALKGSPVLIGITGEHAGSDIELDDSWICIGSDPALSQLVISPGTIPVSPAHCRIRYDSSRAVVVLQDLQSGSGTFTFPGGRLEPGQECMLRPGNRFYIGPRDEICFEVRYQI